MGNLLTLWEDALPPDKIPNYPTVDIRVAKGGEITHELDPECEAARLPFKWQGWHADAKVIERKARPGEPLRDYNLRYIGDYSLNVQHRANVMLKAASDPSYQALQYYFCRSSVLYFCNTFVYTYDPRSKEKHLPFVLYDFQEELITWMVWLIKNKKTGLVDKSREQGLTWLLQVLVVWLALFTPASTVYELSLAEEDVDNYTPDSLLGKVRYILSNLPPWMRGGWVNRAREIDKKMMIKIPQTDSLVIGQLTKSTGGVGGRCLFGVWDEFALVKDDTEALQASSSLAASRLFLSTPRGLGNEFARMAETAHPDLRRSPHWSQHPLKTVEWAKLDRLDPIYSDEIWASEQEIDYAGSTRNRVYPDFISAWEDETKWCHVQDSAFFSYNEAYDVVVGIDFGQGADPTSVVFAQVKGPPKHFEDKVDKCLVFFEEIEGRIFVDDLAEMIKSRGYNYRCIVGDMRTGAATDPKGQTWRKYLRDHGITLEGKYNTEMAPIWEVERLIRVPGAIACNKYSTPSLIRAFQNWSYKPNPETGHVDFHSKPMHNRWSHAMKAVCYLVDWLENGDKTQSRKNTDWRFNVFRGRAAI